jgi:LCP family protein required for cell wall assembly
MKWFRKHKILTALLLTFLLLVGTIAGFAWSKLRLIDYDDGTLKDHQDAEDTFTADASPESDATEAPDQIVDISGLDVLEELPDLPESKIEKQDDVINILLLGTDERTSALNVHARSDCMILVSINKTEKTVKLVSLERGMGVPILEGEYEGQYDWLTHTFRYGGADLVCRTVEECFRVEIDHYVRVNFTTVTTVVDAIGGVGIYLTDAEAQYIGTFTPNIKPGYNWLDGKNALTYARLREIDSDWSRVERQRKVILAAVDSLKNASLTQLNNLLDTVLPLIQTDMTMLEITELMLYSPNFLKSEFDQMTIPKHGTYGGMIGLQGRNLFAVDFEVNSQILKDFLYGDGE